MKTKLKINFMYVMLIAIIAICFVADALSKFYTFDISISLIDGVLSFVSTKNYGGAWSILSGKMTFLIVLTFIFLIGFIIFIFKNQKKNYTFMVGSGLIIGGAIGNLFDRLEFGYVRDFIKLDFMNFPVFNVADICLTVGVIMMMVYIIFYYPKIGVKYDKTF